MFTKTNHRKPVEEEVNEGKIQEENELKMLKVLSNYDAQDIRTSVLPWTQKEGEDSKGRQEPKDKTRFTFKFEN